jgi:alpha-tubulin suppressor-like RCC1 family protein
MNRNIPIGIVLILVLVGCAPAVEGANTPAVSPAATKTVLYTAMPTSTREIVISQTMTALPTAIRRPDVIQLAAGEGHTCALIRGGEVACWGRNDHGQLGDGTKENRSQPVSVVALDSVKAIVVGWGHSCALKNDGAVFCWGYNQNGELGDGSTADSGLPVYVRGLNEKVIDIAAGDDHTCTVLASGGVSCWGFNKVGQLGTGSLDNQPFPSKVDDLGGEVASVSAGWGHTCALMKTGAVKCWGDNELGQLGANSMADLSTEPVEVSGLSGGVNGIAARGGHTCALTSQSQVVCWGDNAYGELGDGTTEMRRTPVSVTNLPADLRSVHAGWNHTCAISDSAGLYCWGRNSYGQLGDGSTISQHKPVPVGGLKGEIFAVDLGWRHSCIAKRSGDVVCWGADEYGQAQDFVSIADMLPAVPDANIDSEKITVPIATGDSHTCMLTSAGGVRCWGDNWNGQMGDGTFSLRKTPVPVIGLGNGVLAVSAGGDQTCALLRVGRVFCWGGNFDWLSQINMEPTLVLGTPGKVVAIAVGSEHACAVLQQGRVMCWGANDHGQLGIGSSDVQYSNYPVYVQGLPESVRAISTLNEHTCVITSSGAVYCWGLNGAGQLGDGTLNTRYQAVPVLGLHQDVIAIAAGGHHTCAILQSGTVYCWGSNSFGQSGGSAGLGILTPILPGPVEGLSGTPRMITAGSFHTCVLSSPQDVFCWGEGKYGKLGDGKSNDSHIPLAVTGLSADVLYLQAGENHTCALVSPWNLFCWGSNDNYQLGDGTKQDYSSIPVRVGT